MHVYAFGSICRGEIELNSDVDLLAIVDEFTAKLDPQIFSIYSYNRLMELWQKGNPFAWHLYSEAQLIFSSNGEDFLKQQSTPAKYIDGKEDCDKFYRLYHDSEKILNNGEHSPFELSNIFLAMRNIATCYSLYVNCEMNFSRNAALRLFKLGQPVSKNCYNILEKSRLLNTRGIGTPATEQEFEYVKKEFSSVRLWLDKIMKEVNTHE